MFDVFFGLMLWTAALTQDETLEPPKQEAPDFAVAKVSSSGQSIAVIARSSTQTRKYTVMVPVRRAVKDENGNEKQVVEMRPEVRTREVKVQRFRTESYTVEVPFEEKQTDQDGNVKLVKKTRTEVRQRSVPRSATDNRPSLHKIDECTITDLNGNPVDRKEVAERLKQFTPIVLGYKGMKLDPFYQAALHPQILLVILPE